MGQNEVDGPGGYTAADIGLPDWGDRRDWENTDNDIKMWCGNGYRYCCNAGSWAGIALAANMMDAKRLWNHNAFFDYVDRYMEIEMVSQQTGSGLCAANLGVVERQWDPFARAVWDTYRSEYGAVWTRDNPGDLYSLGHYDSTQCVYGCTRIVTGNRRFISPSPTWTVSTSAQSSAPFLVVTLNRESPDSRLFRIYNADGALVRQAGIQGQSTTVDISMLPNGVYFCTTGNKETDDVRRIVIAR